eukprot:gnl/TRDRNA2_/TRDRNA2_184636_c0_seq1.p2 gnl/TRDRNA2_/TRDRNA2_184636_c0~~gnl/TRDRNA2_/TRDRNA2_184636_c0_seq1.p2  ORF type:complete len:160 (+),score=8.51 gnl/TRDRNA2_/TRDRNA2_184636_c0_seq1:84-563(+)
MILLTIVTLLAASVRAEHVACNVNSATGRCADDSDDEAAFLQVHKRPASPPAANLTSPGNLVAAKYANSTSTCICLGRSPSVCGHTPGCRYYPDDTTPGSRRRAFGVPKCDGACSCDSIQDEFACNGADNGGPTPYGGCLWYRTRTMLQPWQPRCVNRQ